MINSGSSSIKFAVYGFGPEPVAKLKGELSGIGTGAARLVVGDDDRAVEAGGAVAGIGAVMDAVAAAGIGAVDAVGYRVVHPGAKLTGHVRITDAVLGELRAAKAFAPLHDPEAVEVIGEGMRRYPGVGHYACFDTVFHQTMVEEAKVYALPAEVRAAGVKRYGFHGLSCESVVRRLTEGEGGVPRRLLIAHLGSGCSVTACVEGRSVDTSMGLTPTGGVVMGTRPGDLDPGLVIYLVRQMGGAEAVETMLNHKAGMVALSGQANDMKAVRKAAGVGDADAVLALKVFTRSVRKALGGMCWALGGVDAIVFTGGIGEHDGATRDEVLSGVPGLDGVKVLVVPAEEELMIAIHVRVMAQD